MSENELNSVIDYNDFVAEMNRLVENLRRDLVDNVALKITPGTSKHPKQIYKTFLFSKRDLFL